MRPQYRLMAALAVVAASWLAMPQEVLTQEQPPAIGVAAEPVKRGQAWFYQRCSLCHVGRIIVEDQYQPMAPSLAGVLKGATPEREKLIREYIERGSLRMPGFRYNFTPQQFDELMAYLKTL